MNRACMMHRPARLLILFWVTIAALCIGCASDSATSEPRATVPLVVFTDVHFTPFYDPDIFWDLVQASPDLWADIFEKSSITEPQSWGKETNYPLLMNMLQAAYQASRASPLVLFQGDMLAHKFRETFFDLYGTEDEAALRSFVYKTCAFFAAQVRNHLPGLPVLFVLGNNDSYTGDYKLAPGGEYLAETSDLFYSTLLLEKADPVTFAETYLAGGYYKAQPSPSKVLFICLNTVLFSVNWSSEEAKDAPTRQLDWLEHTLAEARVQGKKVWILMHVPPGADAYGTVSRYMDESGHISDAAMLWKEDYQERFLEIIRPYGDMIEAGFAGHTHMDEYRIMLHEGGESSGTILFSPSVSPQYGNNSGFKVFTVSTADWGLQDYRSVVFPFEIADPTFETYYTFSSAYHLGSPLEAALTELLPELVADEAQRMNYSRFYYSGHDAGNPINDANWPAYWCAICTMSKDDYIGCVNGYR
jgi:sphingomyelin phosphodiesterase acid-like 3